MTLNSKRNNRVRARLLGVFAVTLLIVAALAWQRPPVATAQQGPAIPMGSTVALTGARIIDGTGRPPVENATLVIRAGRVQAVGAGVAVPQGAVRIDVAGKTIIPGLISAHAHEVIQKSNDPKFAALWFDERQKDPVRTQMLDLLKQEAVYGVTTIFALGEQPNRGFMGPSDNAELKKIRDEQAREGLDRTRVFYAGMPATESAKTGADARKNVQDLVARDADIIKLTLNDKPNPEIYTEAIDEAKKHGLKTVTHLAALDVAKGVIKAGGNGLAHSVRDKDVDAELIAMMKASGAFQIPTLTQEQSNFMWASTPAFVHDPFFLNHASVHKRKLEVLLSPENQRMWARSPGTANSRRGLAQAMRNVKLLHDAGIPIAMGTDSGGRMDAGRFEGFMEYEEMDLYFQSGLTEMDIISSATGVAARMMGFDKELGTLEPGKWADFIVLNANPLDNFRNIRQTNAVWIAGHPLPRTNYAGGPLPDPVRIMPSGTN
jgi:imidazolonepropionase-like amidohydrolase